jgi:ferredoxin
MRVEWDQYRCTLSALCTALAPETFSIDEAGQVHVSDEGGVSELSSIQAAADSCPTQAIRIVD